jgi:predicted nucleic acid-binding protein
MVLIDTNILVYTFDPTDLSKQRAAVDIVQQLIRQSRIGVSVQCLTELFNALTRRIPTPLSRADATTQIELVVSASAVFDLTSEVVLHACRGAARHQLSIWDSLIWSAAKANNVPVVLTEDLQHNQLIDGVRILNPFHAQFDRRQLGLAN